MSVVSDEFISPLFEITQIYGNLPFSLTASLDRIHEWKVYKEPPLFNYGSEKRFAVTHSYTNNKVCPYILSNMIDEPIGSLDMNSRLFLRYQLNPYHPPHLPPPPGFEKYIFRNQRPYLRDVIVEIEPLQPLTDCKEVLPIASIYSVCGINVYTEATGVFTEFPRYNPDGLVLIYSTVPELRKILQKKFDDSCDSPSLIVDDVFIEWGSLGLVSLNELHDMGALHSEEMLIDYFEK